jgi:hypothetical protein
MYSKAPYQAYRPMNFGAYRILLAVFLGLLLRHVEVLRPNTLSAPVEPLPVEVLVCLWMGRGQMV